jgi:hypothetical protein
VVGEYTTHHILVDLDTEQESDLLGDAPAAKARVPPFHFDDQSVLGSAASDPSRDWR